MIRAFFHGLVTFGDLMALTTLIGVAVSCLWLTLSTQRQTPESRAVAGRLCGLLIFCLSAMTLSSFYSLINRSSEMSGTGLVAALPVIPTVLFRSHYGAMWLTRLAGLVIAWGVWWIGRRHDSSRLFAALLFCAGGVIAFSRSATGHPADFGDLSLQQLGDWLHLIAVSCWGGAVLAIAYVFPSSAVPGSDSTQRLIPDIAGKFYYIFGPLLATLVMTGLYNAWFSIESFAALMKTPYGWLFSAKLILFGLLVLRYITLPEQGRHPEKFAEEFLGRIRVDALLVCGVLLAVSMVVHRIPARHQLHLDGIKQAAEEKEAAESLAEPVVVLEATPRTLPAGRPVTIKVTLTEPDGSPLKGLELSHERILHTVIISKDLGTFAHIHAEDTGPVSDEMIRAGVFTMVHTFPRAGEYIVGLDFARQDKSYSKTVYLSAGQAEGMGVQAVDFTTTRKFGEYTVNLRTSPERAGAGSETTLLYRIEKNGKAVTDLEPYLGAAMHLAIVPADLGSFMHAHGSPPGEQHTDHLHAAPAERFGPEIESEVVFPARGVYKVFSQIRHRGTVLLFDFMIDVR